MAEEISKLEKERQLDEKIKQVRAKNAAAEQRKREVDKDKQMAEINRSSITSVAKPKYDYDSYSPPERPKHKQRGRIEDPVQDYVRKDPPLSSSSKRPGGRLGDADGPPPDPGYRFLADRMREDEEEDAGRRTREPSHSKSSGNRGGGQRGGAAKTTKSGNVRERLNSTNNNNSTRSDDRHNLEQRRKIVDDEDDDIVIVLEKDRFGRVQSHPSSSNGGGGRSSEDRRTVIRSSDKKINMNSSSHVTPSKPIKSLFEDDDDYDDYQRKERWKPDDDVGILASPRKIEEQGGTLTITRTVENLRPMPKDLETVRKGPQTPKREKEQEMMKNRLNQMDGRHVSDSVWQCSDPCCRNMNQAGTSECSRCRLTFVKSHEYKSNLACSKYKQEFKKTKPTVASQYQQNGAPPSASTASNPPHVNQSIAGGGGQPASAQSAQPFYVPEAASSIGEWKQEAVDMAHYGQTAGDWQSTMGMNQWTMQPDMMMAAQSYGMMVNQVPMSGFPQPPPFYDSRSNQPYYPSPEFMGSPYSSSPQFGYQQQQQQTQAFNPAAQAFVPTSSDAASVPPPHGAMFQTPPPNLVGTGGIRPHPPLHHNMKTTDPKLLVSLKDPPKPLSFGRGGLSDSRKQFPADRSSSSSSSYHRHDDGSGGGHLTSRLSDKNTHSKIPPRLNSHQRGGGSGRRDFGNKFKPPSMVEMQSGSLKKGSIPPPPPSNKGNGLLVFGTSNVCNNLEPDVFSKRLGLPVRLVPAMKQEAFEEKVKEVDPSRDWIVLIHGLGNDARNIATRNKNDPEKANMADHVANSFCDVIENEILSVSSHICVYISMLLPRFDLQERSGLSNPNNVRKIMNVEITERLYQNPRVTLINSDPVLSWDQGEERKAELMESDGYHLTKLGFNLMVDNWLKELTEYINKAKIETSLSNPLLVTDSGEKEEEQEEPTSAQPAEPTETVPDPFGTYTAPTDVIQQKTTVAAASKAPGGESVELDDDSDFDDDDVPSLETVERPPPVVGPFKLGKEDSLTEVHENGDGFIEDDYCGEAGPLRSNPLPSLNLVSNSGPESSDFGPVSGHFMEDSYLPQTLDNLAISEPDSERKASDSSHHAEEPEPDSNGDRHHNESPAPAVNCDDGEKKQQQQTTTTTTNGTDEKEEESGPLKGGATEDNLADLLSTKELLRSRALDLIEPRSATTELA